MAYPLFAALRQNRTQKNIVTTLVKLFLLASLAKRGIWFVFRAKPEKRTIFPFFASEASTI
jgi:hypothetical protein